MKSLITAGLFGIVPLALFCSLHLAVAQGTFQNLDFENAILPVLPSGQSGGFVSSANGIPGWTAYYGSIQTPQIIHNGLSLGAVNISILGPNWNFFPTLEENYSVVLQSGLVASTTPTPAAIGQTGTIPATALSLQ